MEKEKNRAFLLVFLGALVIINLVVLDIFYVFNGQKTTASPLSIIEKIKEAPRPEKEEERIEAPLLKTNDLLLLCREEINKAVASLSAQVGEPKEAPKASYQQPSLPTHPSVVYVSLGGGSSTTTHEWQETGTTETYFDKADYQGVKKITFEAFLKVKHGAGQADVRLYDASHGFVISGSELLGGGADQFEKKSSGPLELLAGNNLYKVQLRSTTGYEVFMESPRLKIEY